MKKILIYIFILSFMISCGGSTSSTSSNNKPQEKDNISKDETSTSSNNKPQEKDNISKDETPCNNIKAEDGETPPRLPSC